jgi:hypothetical protein
MARRVGVGAEWLQLVVMVSVANAVAATRPRVVVFMEMNLESVSEFRESSRVRMSSFHAENTEVAECGESTRGYHSRCNSAGSLFSRGGAKLAENSNGNGNSNGNSNGNGNGNSNGNSKSNGNSNGMTRTTRTAPCGHEETRGHSTAFDNSFSINSKNLKRKKERTNCCESSEQMPQGRAVLRELRASA